MPYTVDGKCVYKKHEDGSRGEKVGCTKGAVKDYLAALYASDKNEAKIAHQEIKEAMKVTEEVIEEKVELAADEVGPFWVVEKPSKDSTLDDICFLCEDVFYFARQIAGGLAPQNVFGIFKNEAKAKKVGEKLLAERNKQMRENLKIGEGKADEIQEEIEIIKQEIEHHMQAAMAEPGTRDAHFADAERLLDDLKQKEALLAKLRGALETEVKKLDEIEKIK